MEQQDYAILGIQASSTDGLYGFVARVRMFLADGSITDEDFALPDLPPGVNPTESIYNHYLQDTILARKTQLEGQTV